MSRSGDYCAAAAKVKALNAKRLQDEDWAALEAMDSVRRISDYLRQSEAWGGTASTDNAEELCKSLGEQNEEVCRRICLYLPKQRDKDYMAFFLRRKDSALTYANADYRDAWQCIEKSYRGLSGLVLKKLLGAEADILNLVYILRLRRFPGSIPEGEKRLIPVRLSLKQELIDALFAAPDDETVLALLKPTEWAATLTDLSPAALDRQYEQYMERFCRKLISGAEPSPAVPVAYMILRHIERCRLTRIIRRMAGNANNNEGR